MVVDVDQNNVVKQIKELKGNQTKNVTYKIQQLKNLIEIQLLLELKMTIIFVPSVLNSLHFISKSLHFQKICFF